MLLLKNIAYSLVCKEYARAVCKINPLHMLFILYLGLWILSARLYKVRETLQDE